MTQEPGSIHLQRQACSTLSAWLLPQIDTWASVFYSGRLSILPATIDYCLLCELLGGFWESPTRIRTSGDPSTGILTPSPCVLRFPYPPKPARQERGGMPCPGLPQKRCQHWLFRSREVSHSGLGLSLLVWTYPIHRSEGVKNLETHAERSFALNKQNKTKQVTNFQTVQGKRKYKYMRVFLN